MSIDKGPSPEPSPPEMSSPASELLADEVASVAVEDPERAADLVAAVAPDKPESSEAPRATGVKPSGLVDAAAGEGGSLNQQVLPGAIVAILLLQLLVGSRFKRLVLAVVGSGLVYAMVTEQQQKP